MHETNIDALNDFKAKYPKSFTGRILELGSHSINGTVRPWFQDCKEYIGIDEDPGVGVDIAVRAQNTKFKKEYFDTIISFSMLEHDLGWKKSMNHNLKFLKKGGTLMLCWGAEGNLPHMDIFAVVPRQDVFDLLKKNNIKILDSFFDEDRYHPCVKGAYTLIGKKCTQ